MGDGRIILCLCDFCAGGAGAGLAEFQQVVKVEGCIDGKAVVAWMYALDQAVEGEIDDALVGVGDLSAELDHNLLDVSFDVVGFPGLKVNEHHSGVDVDIVGGDAEAGPVLLADAVHHAANDLAFKVGVVEFHEAVSDDGVAVYVKDSFAGFRQELGKEQSGELACAAAVLLYAVELGGYLAGGDELDVPVVLGGEYVESGLVFVGNAGIQHIHGDVCHVLVVLEQREHGYAEDLGEVVIAGVNYVHSRPPPKFPVTIPTISHPFASFPHFCAGRQCRET